MSLFSDYFTQLKDARGLSCSYIAELSNRDSSVIFSWLTGKRVPKNWENIENVISKLQISKSEYDVLQDYYIHTVLGEKRYELHKLVMECFEVIRQRSIEYKSNQQLNIQKVMCELNLPKNLFMSSKMELISCLQMCLDYLSGQENKNLYLDFRRMNTDLIMLLNMFLNKTDNCNISLMAYMLDSGEDMKVQNIKIFKDILNFMIQRNPTEIFCFEEVEFENSITENRIISDEFVFIFDANLSYGYMSRDIETITYYKKLFEEAKGQNQNLFIKSYNIMQYAYQYDNSVQGCSYEYMQCIGNCLTREIIEDHIYNDIPQREYIIEGLCKSNIYNEWNWWSVFTYEGLIEFMETGNIQNFPYQLYRKPDMKVRCELLENAIKTTKKREFCYYMIKSDKMYSMKEYYLEMYLKARVSINFYNEKGTVGRFVFENPIIASVFEEMNGYLEKIGYIYSHEKTCEIMQKVLEEYKAKI